MYRTQNFQKLIRACCTKCIHFFCLVSCDKTTQCDLKLLNKENEGGGECLNCQELGCCQQLSLMVILCVMFSN